jgi:hypothetical protein
MANVHLIFLGMYERMYLVSLDCEGADSSLRITLWNMMIWPTISDLPRLLYTM